jgi:TRAP-type C4-dicarboxylate transport system permease small subunit
MLSFEKTVYGFSRTLNILSGIALVIMMGLVFVNVVLRAVWKPILGTYEFTGFLAAITITFALAHCASKKGHIAITLIADLFPLRVQAIFDSLIAILSTALYAVISWQCVKYAINLHQIGEVSPATATPFYPFIYAVAFGLLMLAFILLNDVFKSIGKIFK